MTIVTVVTVKLAVVKLSSQPSRPSRNRKKLQQKFCAVHEFVTIIFRVQIRQGSRKNRKPALCPQAAHGTLQTVRMKVL